MGGSGCEDAGDVQRHTVGTRKHVSPKIVQQTKKYPFYFQNCAFTLIKNVPLKLRAPTFEMLPTSMGCSLFVRKIWFP